MPHTCPVCGYPGLQERPRDDQRGGSFEICPSCGFQFGVTDDDRGVSIDQWREQWVRTGMIWDAGRSKPPLNWNPKAQLKNASAPRTSRVATLFKGVVDVASAVFVVYFFGVLVWVVVIHPAKFKHVEKIPAWIWAAIGDVPLAFFGVIWLLFRNVQRGLDIALWMDNRYPGLSSAIRRLGPMGCALIIVAIFAVLSALAKAVFNSEGN